MADELENESQPPQEVDRRGLSWAAMLGWIGLAFLLAGLVAWRLVAPFFHHA